ncbi:hydroxyethylthiazole kinase [Bowdeniella nasicola]|uniref:Hydroxyethylthiazole kinase n=1 Tax=Bowdeniella nasicola TaxID=208480 RepID=A0A1Q5PZA0_9ACTO|nr:hydroxyethylthiazole kinase [Bowdeniella nasicola]OKL52958.1 hydroxyethylthiazole kinase [Bowdeniella nasicola]
MSFVQNWRDVLGSVRAAAPLVHCLSATVSMEIVADGLLAAGARPMMTETLDEAPIVTTAADAVLINLGTLSTDGMLGIPATVDVTRDRGVPWVLDPTAIGLAPVRTALARTFADLAPTVIRGNASEILVLADKGSGGRGADATTSSLEVSGIAHALAGRLGTVVAMSGATDVISDGSDLYQVTGGDEMLTQVTGTGCLLTALTAACCVVASPVDAALAASRWMKAAAETAAARSSGPGSFRMHLLDALNEEAR